MAANKVGTLIKEARTAAGLSQEKLAGLIEGVSASDIGKAERGEKTLTQEQLKAIAKATGVTQKSLLEAAKEGGSTAKKTSTAKTSASKTSSSKTSSSGSSMKVSASEKKLVELYRKADADTKKQVMNLLKGTETDASELITNLIGNMVEQFIKK